MKGSRLVLLHDPKSAIKELFGAQMPPHLMDSLKISVKEEAKDEWHLSIPQVETAKRFQTKAEPKSGATLGDDCSPWDACSLCDTTTAT